MGWRIRVSRGHPTDDRNWTVSSVHNCLTCRDDSEVYLSQFNLDGSATAPLFFIKWNSLIYLLLTHYTIIASFHVCILWINGLAFLCHMLKW
uniref:Uncharacterized protein n=1 Tax=Arundo donax TaxID=35708 RepID=A0A0A9ED37_ARUDO